MGVTTGDKITKADLVNYFNTNMVNVAFNGLSYHSGSVPTYTATAQSGTQGGTLSNITGAQAIPSTQLSANTKPSMTVDNITDTIISATTIVNKMKEIATNCSRIRNTVSNWYHDTSGTNNLVQTISGKAIYLATTPAISGTTKPYYTKSPTATAMTTASAVTQSDLAKSSVIKASSISTFITNLVNEWNTRYNTTVTFTYYTCHSVCHSSCYTRARR